MSTWVQVECIVKSPIEIDMEKVFGKELPLTDQEDMPKYELYRQDEEKYLKEMKRIAEHDRKAWEDYEKHPDDYLPVGSEGSLTHYILDKSWFDPDIRNEYAIRGSLRNRFDDYEYVKWFRDKFLDWLNSCNTVETDKVYAFVSATNGVGSLSWEYGE